MFKNPKIKAELIQLYIILIAPTGHEQQLGKHYIKQLN